MIITTISLLLFAVFQSAQYANISLSGFLLKK